MIRRIRIFLAQWLVSLAADIQPMSSSDRGYFLNHWYVGKRVVTYGIAKGYSLEEATEIQRFNA